MLTRFSMWILFLTSYMPLFVIFLINYLFSLNFNYDNFTTINVIVLVTIVACIVIPPFVLCIIIRFKTVSTKHIEVHKINSTHSEILNYILVYIIPFITTDLSHLSDVLTFSVFLIILGMIYVKNSLIHINPTLYLAGYNIYSINNNQILISKSSHEKIYTDGRLRRVSVLGSRIYLDCQK